MEDDSALTVAMAERIFQDFADPQALSHQPEDVWKPRLWQSIEDSGLPRCWVPEGLGGHGLDMMAGFALLRACGKAALPVPLAETMVASWVLASAGLRVPEGSMTVLMVPNHPDSPQMDKRAIKVRKVPFAAASSALVVVEEHEPGRTRVALVPSEKYLVQPGLNLAGDASDSVSLYADSLAWVYTDALNLCDVVELGAVVRSLQMAGALESMLSLSVEYSQVRVAFGKPISKFQAIQHNLARLGGEVAAATAVSMSAAEAFSTLPAGSSERFLEVASAKIRCGEAAQAGASISHQVHGAIGFTFEHVLHRYTMRALAWRDDFGSESEWALRLGEHFGPQSSTQLWNLLSSR